VIPIFKDREFSTSRRGDKAVTIESRIETREENLAIEQKTLAQDRKRALSSFRLFS